MRAARAVLCNDQTPMRKKESERSLLCLLEAFEHVNDLVLLVQTKFPPRQRVDQRFCLAEGVFEIIGLCDDSHSIRCASGNLGWTNSLQQRLPRLWRQFTSRAAELEYGDELLEEDVEGRYWKVFRHHNGGTR